MSEFGKTRRLLKKADFDAVHKQAKKMVTDEFIILYCFNTIGHSRLGLALSKKAIPKAHDRNRIKRLIRETFRNRSLPPIDMIFLARSTLLKLENKTLLAKLDKIWKKLIALYVK